MPALFRRREVWLPTLWGALVLLAVFVGVMAALVVATPSFLAVNAPSTSAKVLVIEGWLDDHELDRTIGVFRAGRYERIVTTGGPIETWMGTPSPWKTFADRAAGYLAMHGVSGVPIDAVGAPASAQDRTFLSAVVLREWAARQGIRLDAIDLLTSGVHARRSRMMFRAALGPNVDVGVIAVAPSSHDMQRWWATSGGSKAVLSETISLVWTACCFWPPAPGSHEERWAIPPAADSASSAAAAAKAP